MIGENIQNYKSYPRIIGETGGKDFILAHESSNRKALTSSMIKVRLNIKDKNVQQLQDVVAENVWNDIKDDYIKGLQQ